MSREKQIEEMARDLCESYNDDGTCYCDGKPCDLKCENFTDAQYIYVKGYRKQSEWISVEDRLPDYGDSFLVVVKLKYEWETEWEYHVDVAGFCPGCGGYIDDMWTTFNDWDEGQECHVTHWMPLPEAPKMKGGAE